MAIGVPTLAAEGYDAAGTDPVVSASFTVPDGDICYICCFQENGNIGTVSTAHSVTLTSRLTDGGGSIAEIVTFTGDATTASTAQTAQFTKSGGGGGIVIITISGANETPVNTQSNTWAPGSNKALVLAGGNIAATSVILGLYGGQSPAAPATITGTATELSADASFNGNMSTAYDDATTDTITSTHGGDTSGWIGFEVEEAAGGGGGLPLPTRRRMNGGMQQLTGAMQ